MSETTPATRLLAAVSWAAYCVSFTFLVLFLKVQFNARPWTTVEYILLAGSILGAYAGSHVLARRGSSRWNVLALFGCHMVVAAVSFWIFWSVPLGRTTFSCPASDAACGVAGQVISCAVILGASPPLLARLSRDTAGTRGTAGTMPAMVTVLAGAALLAIGIPAASQPGWAPLGAWLTAMAGAIVVMLMAIRGVPDSPSLRPQPGGGLVAIRSIILLVVAAILGFAVMAPGSNLFILMPGIGAGVLLSGCLHLVLDRVLPRASLVPLTLLEGGILVMVMTSSLVSWWLASSGVELRASTGMHEAITGFVLGFAWARHARATAGEPYVNLQPRGRFKGISTHGASTFWFFLLSFLVAAAALVVIMPWSQDVVFLHAGAILLCSVALASWVATARSKHDG